MTTIHRYHRLRNEYDHYQRRHRMLHSITIQKRDELEHLSNHINQLLLSEDISIKPDNQLHIGSSVCVYDHGDHSSMSPMISLGRFSSDEDEESDDDDPLLQRLKLTKPSRLKSSSRQFFNTKIHTVYNEDLLSE